MQSQVRHGHASVDHGTQRRVTDKTMKNDYISQDAPAPPGPRRRRWQGRDIAPLVSLAVLGGFFSIAAPNFLKPATPPLIVTGIF